MNGETTLKTLLVISFFLVGMISIAAGRTIYVDVDAAGANDGTSWTNAYNYLQDALLSASNGDEIRVAQGRYRPDDDSGHPSGTGDREATFRLNNGVSIKGGYAGFDEPDPNARDIGIYKTVLSGDLNGDDGPNFANNDDNSYHVVTGSGTNETAVLDGFTVTSGNANGANWESGGSGMYNVKSSPTLTNCTFNDNSAEFGGGMLNFESNPTVTNCTFSGNRARWGGGMENESNSNPSLIGCSFNANSATMSGGGIRNHKSSPNILDCLFIVNEAQCGGAIQNENNDSKPTFTRCSFIDNKATSFGGAIRNHTSSPTVLNCLIVANRALSGGGIHNENDISNPTLINCTLNRNSAGQWGGGIMNKNSAPVLSNCILWDNSDNGGWDLSAQIRGGLPVVNYCCIRGWRSNFGGIGNFSALPWFVKLGYRNDDGIWINGDYHLQRRSICIDAGDKSAVPPSLSTDLDGNPRIKGNNVDMGVYEHWCPLVLHVDRDADGANDGSNWTNAYNDLQDALADAILGDEIRVAQGVYKTDEDIPPVPPIPPPLPMPSGSEENTAAVDKEREATFQLKNGVVIKGGYAGAGEPDPNARDTGVFETILSGDIRMPGVNLDNSYQVVTGSYCDETAVLDGFTITGGNANGPYPYFCGGGMYNRSGSPTVKNCIFTDNSATWDGGGVWNGNGSPGFTNCTFGANWAEKRGGGMANNAVGSVITNCIFSDNHAGVGGGGMSNYSSKPVITGCTFEGNTGTSGGGMRNTDDVNDNCPVLIDCTFISNSAHTGAGMNNSSSNPVLYNCCFLSNMTDSDGGGMSNWNASPFLINCVLSGNTANGSFGGGALRNYKASPRLMNCIVTNNSSANKGGAICNHESYLTVTNCTFAGNSALDGNALACDSPSDMYASDLQVSNCILWDGGNEVWSNDNSVITITYSDVQGGWLGQGNIDADPWFVDSANGDYRLLTGSLCIGAGDNNSIPADLADLDGDGDTNEPIPIDLDGNPRIVGAAVDMGAYEYQNTVSVADAGPDQVVECACNTGEGTKVTLDGTGSYDADGDVLTYTWTGPFVESPAHGAATTVTLEGGCPGEYIITLVVNDGIDDSEPNEVVITVVDTTPPEFALSVSPVVLWPPNHQMVLITPTWTVSDKCDITLDVSLVSISVNESDIKGSGHADNDIQIDDDGSIYLRAERSGTGSDRIYTITYRAVDDCGNTAESSATVTVPHDQR